MKFGIIGAGRIGKIHGGNVAARSDSQVAFVADADPAAGAALAKATGGKVAEIDAILASKDVDAVAICSPTDTHADLIERAARAKKAIFCEKPIHLDVDRVRACLEVVKQTGATLMVGFNRRFDPNFSALRKRVAEGAIGALEIVSITSRDPGPPPISYIERSGGLFRDMMIHDFDLARFILGEEPVAVSAMGSALVDKAIGDVGDIDTAVVIMETASGQGGADLEFASRGLRLRSAGRGAWRERAWFMPRTCARRQSSLPAHTDSPATRRSTSFSSATRWPIVTSSTRSSAP